MTHLDWIGAAAAIWLLAILYVAVYFIVRSASFAYRFLRKHNERKAFQHDRR